MIVVTGGAGLIGSAVVWELNQQGHSDIVIVDHLGESDKWQNLRALDYADYYEKEDFIDMILDDFDNTQNIEMIIHMGACSATTEKDASYLANNNFAYTKLLCQWAMDNDVRFVTASSAATYGLGEQGYSDEVDIKQLRPLNMYGYSKQLFDLWAKKHNYLDKIVSLKFFNVYGPNEYHKANMRSVVIRAFEQITATGEMELFKSYDKDYQDGKQMRDFFYVKDAAKIVIFLANNHKANGIFNVGSGNADTWNDLVGAVFKALGKPEKIKYIEMPEHLKSKYQYYTKAEIDRLRDAGYSEAFYSLEAAIKDYVVNYLQNSKHLGDE